jgi:hypothetical protein
MLPFGVDCSAVTGAVKRGEQYVEEDELPKKTVQKIINDM